MIIYLKQIVPLKDKSATAAKAFVANQTNIMIMFLKYLTYWTYIAILTCRLAGPLRKTFLHTPS